MFHSWGFMHFTLGLALGLDLRAAPALRPRGGAGARRGARRRRADRRPGDAAADHGADEETRNKYDLPSLRVTAVSGSALPGELAIRWMDAFGDNLYNLYGSTEVAWASIATPEDMRAAPGTAGRAAARDRRQALRRGRQGGPAGRDRPDLRRQRDVLRGLHRRRRQGRHRRPALVRRRRPLRRATAASSSTAATTR